MGISCYGLYAQPLLVDQVHTTSSGIKDVLLVATASNYLYAFAADGSSLTPLWTRWFGAPMNVTGCSGYGPSQFSFGILGTPVLDGTTLYLVAETGPNGCVSPSPLLVGATHILYAVDIKSGSVLRQSQPIGASVPGFNSNVQIQRPGLAFVGGKVLMAFGSINDKGPFSGWVLAYDATTMTPTAQFCTNCGPPAGGAAIWQGGNAIAVDGSSNAYVMTGNNTGGAGGRPDQFIKLNGSFSATASYAPTLPAVGDLDLGSSGPILIPGTSPTLLAGGGKEGKLYLLNTTAMTLASTITTVNQYLSGAPVAMGDYPHLDLTTSPRASRG